MNCTPLEQTATSFFSVIWRSPRYPAAATCNWLTQSSCPVPNTCELHSSCIKCTLHRCLLFALSILSTFPCRYQSVLSSYNLIRDPQNNIFVYWTLLIVLSSLIHLKCTKLFFRNIDDTFIQYFLVANDILIVHRCCKVFLKFLWFCGRFNFLF